MQRLWNGKLAIVLFVLVASYAPVEVFAQPISPSANSVKIERIVAEVRAEQDIGKRTNLIQKLAIDLQYVDSSSIDDEAIDAITQLLLDRDDSVVNWAAGALGNIGPRAKHAIPALEQA